MILCNLNTNSSLFLYLIIIYLNPKDNHIQIFNFGLKKYFSLLDSLTDKNFDYNFQTQLKKCESFVGVSSYLFNDF